MTELNKWSLLDHGKTAHWWVGQEGTACGRDFRTDIRLADDEDSPLCEECRAYLTYLERGPRDRAI